jgi:hypothetical protein
MLSKDRPYFIEVRQIIIKVKKAGTVIVTDIFLYKKVSKKAY